MNPERLDPTAHNILLGVQMSLPTHGVDMGHFQNHLCLVCRQTGHVVEKCPWYIHEQWEEYSIDPPGEPTRPAPPLSPLAGSEDTQGLCQRCSQLDGLVKTAAFRPFVLDDFDDNHSKRATKKTTQLPCLGPILSLRLLSTCPLCRFLFNVSYVADKDMEIVRAKGELVLIPAWTIHRLEKDVYWEGHEKGRGRYAKCLYTSVNEGEDGVYSPTDHVEVTAEAFGIVDIEESPSDGPALGVRPVNPKTPDWSVIKDWLRRCDDLHHITCGPSVSDSLKQIKLVDVETRQVVVYPVDGCAYVALSYVWGSVQQTNYYRAGDILPTVPATLEDAMVVVRNLGKRYLWADSLCIDQDDDEEKAVQVALMGAIYSGAWATIICLSSRSAESGIPRVGTLEGVIAQLSCEVWGKRLLSMMPTLSQQISWSPWASRAWTYQEGLLSPRRLFFTNHQVYFECNSVQCCESLNDTNSPFHLPSNRKRRATLHDVVLVPEELEDMPPESVIGRGVLRDPFRPLSTDDRAQVDEDRFTTYLRLVHSYTMRKMTKDADSLNAFSAMLARLEENHYEEGFIQGLPIQDFPSALLWFHPAPPRRRLGFPAWSWAGWEGEINDDGIPGAKNSSEALMPPLRVWKAGCDEPVYNFNPENHIISTLRERSETDDEDEDDEDEDEDEDVVDDVDNDDDLSDYVVSEDVDDSGSDSGYESDEVDEELSEESFSEEIMFENDPVFRISKEKIPWVLPKIDQDELRIEGIIIRLSFVETAEDHSSDSETDDEHGRCFVRVGGHRKPQGMRFYGHNAAQLASQRSNKEQEFLLVSREDNLNYALFLIDRDGKAAQRVGVASLRLDNVELLNGLEPERRIFKLQ